MDNAIGIAECLYQLGTIEQLLKDYNEATNLYSMALKVAHGVQVFFYFYFYFYLFIFIYFYYFYLFILFFIFILFI